jgi:hypothetical protein
LQVNLEHTGSFRFVFTPSSFVQSLPIVFSLLVLIPSATGATALKLIRAASGRHGRTNAEITAGQILKTSRPGNAVGQLSITAQTPFTLIG